LKNDLSTIKKTKIAQEKSGFFLPFRFLSAILFFVADLRIMGRVFFQHGRLLVRRFFGDGGFIPDQLKE